MPATKFTAIGLLFILYASPISCQDSEETSPLTIEPFRLTIEVGTDVTFDCVLLAEYINNSTRISWFLPDNVTEIQPESNSTRIYVEESKLHINNAQENDSGEYICRATSDNSLSTVPVDGVSTMHGGVTVTQPPVSYSTNGRATDSTVASSNSTSAEKIPDSRQVITETQQTLYATAELKVYVMPTYFTEGMIILGINLGLLLVFLICLAQSLVSERKRMQSYHKK